MKLKIKGFDAQLLETKSGSKLLIEVGNRDTTALDKCVREQFNVLSMIESDDKYNKNHTKMICYILRS